MRTSTRLLVAGTTLCVFASCNSGSVGFGPRTPLPSADTVAIPDNPARDSTAVMLSKEATLKLFVPNIAHAFRATKSILAKDGGYYTEWNESRKDDIMDGILTIKVPAVSFDSFTDSLDALGSVLDESVNATDVSEAYEATEADAAYRKRSMDRYLTLLKSQEIIKGDGESSLTALADVDTLDQGITEVAGSARRLRYEVAMSTIHLEFRQFYDQPVDPRDRFGYHWMGSLRLGWSMIQWVIIALTALWPLILGGAALTMLLYRKRSGKRNLSV